jgi:hypothetical protein
MRARAMRVENIYDTIPADLPDELSKRPSPSEKLSRLILIENSLSIGGSIGSE